MEIGGKPQQLTSDSFYKQSPAWSPDGTRIAYCSDKAGTADIYVLDLATKAERRVTNFADSAELEPAWSPDGKKLAFQKQDGTTYTVDLAGGEIREAIKATFAPSRPSWSANNKAISFAALRPYSRRFREGPNLILTDDLDTEEIRIRPRRRGMKQEQPLARPDFDLDRVAVPEEFAPVNWSEG